MDTHGQSEVGFAFCYLLGCELLPRLKHLRQQRLYWLNKGDGEPYAHIQAILTRPIQWELMGPDGDFGLGFLPPTTLIAITVRLRG